MEPTGCHFVGLAIGAGCDAGSGVGSVCIAFSSAATISSIKFNCQGWRRLSSEQRQNFFLDCARDAGVGLADIHIYFAANAKFRQVNSRLDGEAGVRHDFAVVARFETVHVRTVSVNGFTDAVPGAMDEIFGIAGFPNDVARGTVDLPSVKGLPEAMEERIN